MTGTPICVFVYKRVDTFENLIHSLLQNPECIDAPLIIFSDAARFSKDEAGVVQVREFAASIDGFASIEIVERGSNFGLAKSIITGVSQILEAYERVIVLEDDLVVSSNFLAYMHQCLDKYSTNRSVCSISAYSSQRIADLESNVDVYFGRRSSSWGWGTWRDRWIEIDWNVPEISVLDSYRARKEFKRGGEDLVRMLRRQQQGKIDSWAIRFSFYQFLTNSFDVVPRISKVLNSGFSGAATNTAGMEDRFATTLDTSGNRYFTLPDEPYEDDAFMKAFRVPFKLSERLKFKAASTVRNTLSAFRVGK